MIKDLIEDIERFYPVLESLIKEKNIKTQWLEDLYKIFLMEDNEYTTPLKYQLFITLRNNTDLIDYDLFSQVLNLTKDDIFYLLKNQGFEVYFPVYDLELKDSYIAKAFIVENTQKTFSFNYFLNLESVKKATGKEFFVVFDKIFKGNSFQLAITAGLIANDKTILKNLAFTGEVTSSGKVLPVNHIPEKEKAVLEKGFTLITPEDIESIEQLDFWLNSPDIPVILLNRNNKNDIIQSLQQVEETIKQDYPYFNINNLQKFYNINQNDLTLITENIDFSDKKQIQNILDEVEEKFRKLFTIKSAVLYISISISSLGFFIGALLGSRKRVVILHYINNKYLKAIDARENIRVIKQIKNQYEILQVKECNPDEETAVILHIASHNPVEKSLRYIEKNIPNAKTCIAQTIYNGNIPTEEFLPLHQELYNFINTTIRKKLHIFHSMPTPLALSLGMAIGHFWDINIYHFDNQKSEYVKIPVNLKEVVSKF
ncbi:SAVED domain-containing protein [Sulfurihydrogenibium sp.]|uniref:SAVED domain-containing protein n=1 Tax=Sulfurihydrogenibium sp. TaxID=2053621 RepID=UPI00261A84DE|nr:SAVED domain-containing protein [Sulfurihydrogenibium sp.]